MYKRSYGRPSYGQNQNSYGSGRPSYRGRGGGRGGGGRRNSGSNIHESMFVKKAVEPVIEEAVAPTTTFSELNLQPQLYKNIQNRGFTHPTPIQEHTIKPILEGKDIVGIANTGSGKTGAFLIPLLNKIVTNPNERILIVVPTRELAMQIQTEMRAFSQGMNIYSTLCIGGASIRNQIFELRRNPHFVIGTPGRLKDLAERKALYLAQYKTLILDEVDRMLDMGFIHDIKHLVSMLPEQKQSLFFSATVSPEISTLIQTFLKNPITVSLKKQETSHNVEQDVVRVQGGNKFEVLENLLKKEEFKKVLIFGKTKHGVERLSVNLFQKGFKVTSIHGDKPQFKRSQAIRMFQENVVQILVATDVASRGIDINDITHVINYDKPATYDDYVHRIGRTGRANKKGVALTFLD